MILFQRSRRTLLSREAGEYIPEIPGKWRPGELPEKVRRAYCTVLQDVQFAALKILGNFNDVVQLPVKRGSLTSRKSAISYL